MAIYIENSEIDHLIKELCQLTGLDSDELIKTVLEREYQQQRQQKRQRNLSQHLDDLQKEAQHKTNDFDPNTLYDEHGLPE